jgi:6-pyruvoyltetrahydropterin/6-carboxytetrahydropterin synthase
LMTITAEMQIPMGHRLPEHAGKCKFYHGHNYDVEVYVEGLLNTQGMVIDYKTLRETMKLVLDRYDHSMVVVEDDPFIELFSGRHRVLVVSAPPTAEVLAALWFRQIQEQLGSRAKVTCLKVRETSNTAALCTSPIVGFEKPMQVRELAAYNV